MSNTPTLRLYFDTVRHLKLRQLYFGVLYRVKKIFYKPPVNTLTKREVEVSLLNLIPSLPHPQTFFEKNFSFLNLTKSFEGEIDWDYLGHGKLWAYNLNYFDFLNQQEIRTQDAISILDSFCAKPEKRREGSEPYPISLRGINWIKFFSSRRFSNSRYNKLLFANYEYLSSNLEYHLLGNHLLENGFSLLFGAYYFRNDKFYDKAEKILLSELKEQILEDGAHFELSPMYHQTLLYRLLDCINVVKNNSWKERALLNFLNQKARLMLGWLNEVTFSNGDVPMVNDSAYGISPSSADLLMYSNRLGVAPVPVRISSSGYRMIRMSRMELFIDVGDIGPDYIPGHAHSDTLNFILHVDQKAVIVDTATSTYEKNNIRHIERSTKSHNTVTVNNTDQSETWASFRVGKRAKIVDLKESGNTLGAAHNGYRSIGLQHHRQWQWEPNEIRVSDNVSGSGQIKQAMACYHFHPNVAPTLENNIVYAGSVRLSWTGADEINVADYDFAAGFNKRVKSKMVIVTFARHLETNISISGIETTSL
jgi:hypothetical protein